MDNQQSASDRIKAIRDRLSQDLKNKQLSTTRARELPCEIENAFDNWESLISQSIGE